MQVDPIDPDEKLVLTFDYTGGLDSGETLTGTITTTVAMALGSDATPTSVLNGVASFDGTSKKVLMPVKGGLIDRDYAIKVVSGTTNALKVLALVAHLPIRQDM